MIKLYTFAYLQFNHLCIFNYNSKAASLETTNNKHSFYYYNFLCMVKWYFSAKLIYQKMLVCSLIIFSIHDKRKTNTKRLRL